jgi:hypothetical protein
MRNQVQKTLDHMLDRVVLLRMPKTAKDPSDLHVADPDGFAVAFADLLERNTVKLVDVLAEDCRVQLDAAWAAAPTWLRLPISSTASSAIYTAAVWPERTITPS